MKKKILVSAVLAIVLMMSFSIIAYATSYSCTLRSTANEAHTASLSTKTAHYSAYNSMSSSDNMYVKLQTYAGGEWIKVGKGLLGPGDYGSSSSVSATSAKSFRTKIYTQDGNGGVEGTGCVFNY